MKCYKVVRRINDTLVSAAGTRPLDRTIYVPGKWTTPRPEQNQALFVYVTYEQAASWLVLDGNREVWEVEAEGFLESFQDKCNIGFGGKIHLNDWGAGIALVSKVKLITKIACRPSTK